MTSKVATGAQLWASERKVAAALGCKLEAKLTPSTLAGGGTAYARLSPITEKAAALLTKAAAEDGAPGRKAIEVRQQYDTDGLALEAVDAAVREALELGRSVLA